MRTGSRTPHQRRARRDRPGRLSAQLAPDLRRCRPRRALHPEAREEQRRPITTFARSPAAGRRNTQRRRREARSNAAPSSRAHAPQGFDRAAAAAALQYPGHRLNGRTITSPRPTISSKMPRLLCARASPSSSARRRRCSPDRSPPPPPGRAAGVAPKGTLPRRRACRGALPGRREGRACMPKPACAPGRQAADVPHDEALAALTAPKREPRTARYLVHLFRGSARGPGGSTRRARPTGGWRDQLTRIPRRCVS